ncbi:hypothetical protein [Methylobrevis albus]|uniref:DUF4398 domain-containing protein n=1 Tax=Methylobrevis albus TaxID=2793297 RepID=A0A931I5L8_9HYPH|nr:hypothetical protein [Methylobrevis albus]MBH0239716.1 hypothetical protein [Methylobrevis albus]
MWTARVVSSFGRRLGGVAALAAVLGACASGPSDFADFPDMIAPPQQSQIVTKSPEQLAATQDSLTAAARGQAGAAARADDGLGPAMALAVIRQQQEEEARLLLEQAEGLAPVAPAGQ